jgi:glycosyltransferase involved in cell wall biosynthesis
LNIALISACTFPASLPDDINATQGYGSESYNAVLCQALTEAGHNVNFYAPIGSSKFRDNPRVRYHPIKNSHGDHIDEILNTCASDGSRYTDLLDVDFVISGEKQGHNLEQLHYHNPSFKKYCSYRSGYADFIYPAGLPNDKRHYVTHCKDFQEQFKAAGFDADVCFFGIPDFWHPVNRLTDEFTTFFAVKYNLEDKKYWLFPHRPSVDKGIDSVLKVAQRLPDETFVISTAAPLPDHKATLEQCKRFVKDAQLHNVKFVEIPQTPYYQFHRRALICGAKAVLCPYPWSSDMGQNRTAPYRDTGGLTGAEAMSCQTPLIVTRSPGSEEWWGEQDEKGVVFVDGFDSLRMVIKNWSTYDLHPQCPYTTQSYANDYLKVISKYS